MDRVLLIPSRDACSHGLVRALAEDVGPSFRLAAALTECAGAGEIIGIFDTHDLATPLQVQAWCRRRAVPFIRVGLDADGAEIGPIVADPEAGCIGCLAEWSQQRWPAPTPRPDPFADVLWPTPTYEIVAAIVRGCVDARVQSAGLPPGRRFTMRVDAVTGSTARHSFVPHPNCTACRPVAECTAEEGSLELRARLKASPECYRATSTPIDPIALRREFVDEHCGLVRATRTYTKSHLMPMEFAYQLNEDARSLMLAGVGRTGAPASSAAVAILECLERFCGLTPRARAPARVCRYSELNSELAEAAIDPRRFILPATEQCQEPGYRLPPYHDDMQIGWCWGHSLRRSGPVLVPEQICYFGTPGLGPLSSPQPRFVPETSNGCALGGSIEEATLHGLFEVLERDAFLTTWYGSLEPVEIDPSDAQDPTIRAMLARISALGLEAHLFDIGVGFSVAVILAILLDRRPDPPLATYCAAGAHRVPEKAAVSALVEAMTSVVEVDPATRRQTRARARAMIEDGSLVQSQDDHVLAYSVPECLPRLAFLLGTRERELLGQRFAYLRAGRSLDLTIELRQLVAEVLAVADDVLIVDQSCSVLDRFGLSCVRVLAPGLLPMTFGHQYRRVSMPRIRRAIEMTGRVPRRPDFDRALVPHNFP